MRKKSRSKRDKTYRSTSTLDQHSRRGTRLVPPLLALPGTHLVSWSHEQIPEILWAALLVTELGRVPALNRFRDVGDFVFNQVEGMKVHDITHSGLARLERRTLRDLLIVVAREPRFASALSPLLLLENLPARDLWTEVLQHADEKKGWESLMEAVAKVFNHQSTEATDCRWLKVLICMLGGKLHLPWKETVKEILEYPSQGDMQSVRPIIRATEMAVRNVSDSTSAWADTFWAQCYRDTDCFAFVPVPYATRPGIDLDDIENLYTAIGDHAAEVRTSTALDERHDVVFGTTLYGVTVLHEIVSGRVDGGVLGHVGLRVIAESVINLT